MAFQSSRTDRRTWDPESGWELRYLPPPPGHVDFRLWHPEKPSFQFEGYVDIVRLDQRGADGDWLHEFKYRIHNIDGRSPRFTRPVRKKLIEEALHAFGVIHDGPLGPIHVEYAG